MTQALPTNKQEYLDLLIKTSKENGFPAIDPVYNKCKYRVSGNKKCAIGLLIPDDKYSCSLENKFTFQIIRKLSLGMRDDAIPWISTDELCVVQTLHDNLAREFVALKTDWDHVRFVRELKESYVFNGCEFPKEISA